MVKFVRLILFFLTTLLSATESEQNQKKNAQADLQVEYGIDSLERRYYHPRFQFKFPFKAGNYFLDVEYHSRLNGRLQGAIDYWINTGVNFRFGNKSFISLVLNHFCRHQTGRKILYVWNFNELLAKLTFSRQKLQFFFGGGTYIGGSDVYRYLLIAGIEKSGLIFPELKFEAQLKLVNLDRFFYQYGLAIGLNKSFELFYRRSKDYEFDPLSYVGLRFNSRAASNDHLQFIKIVPGFFLADNEHKLELTGLFRFSFFEEEKRQLIFNVNFSTPVFAGKSFFAEFNPDRMSYILSLEYEKRLSRDILISWLSAYKLDQPVDLDLPFKASLFSGLSLKNQSNFDQLNKNFRYNLAFGYDFKKGFCYFGKVALKIVGIGKLIFWKEFDFEIDRSQKNFSFWLFLTESKLPEIRPFFRWRKEWPRGRKDSDLLVGVGLFFPGLQSKR